VTGAALGAAVTSAGWWVAWRRWAESHHYDRVRLGAVRVREVVAEADHEHRLRLRIEHQRDMAQAAVWDLLERAAARAHTHTPRRLARRSPVPVYGADR